MTFFDAAKELGKRPCTIVQLHLSRCANDFGVAPCTAVGTGNQKCFRTRSSCRDAPNYAETDLFKYNFSTTRVSGFQNLDESPVFPVVTAVDTAPTVLTPGKGLGVRSSVKVDLQDFPWTDVYSDPYRTERTGAKPEDIGTFFGKLLARNRYHENRRVTVHTGFLTDSGMYDANNFQTRTYFITNISGPDANGKVTLEAKDPIKFADNTKSQFPTGSRVVLNADIDAVQTTITIKDVAGELGAAGPINFLQRYLKIDNEIFYASGFSFPGTPVPGAVYTITVVRGPAAFALAPSFYQPATNIAAEHSALTSVQHCYRWYQQEASDIIYELLIASGIPSAYIESPAVWQADFINSGLGDYKFTTLLVKPEGIKNLLDEIAEHNILIWWDERAQKVKCRALVFRSALNTLAFNETSNIIEETQNIIENSKERVTQVWLAYNVINPTYDLRRATSYEVLDIAADLSLSEPEKYGQNKVAFIYSRWLENGSNIAPQVSARRLQRYQDTVRVVSFEVDPKDSQYWVGDNVRIELSQYQDEFGKPRRANYLITQVDETIKSNGVFYRITAVEQPTYNGITATWTVDPGSTIPGGLPSAGAVMPADFDSADEAIREAYAFWGYSSGQFSNGQASYVYT